jgi:hypothetical protein
LRELEVWSTRLVGEVAALGGLTQLERLDMFDARVDNLDWLQVWEAATA